MTDVGEFIRMQRRLAQLSLRQLAELADVSDAYLSQVERGLYKPSAQVLKNVADALHVSTETVFRHAGLLGEDRPGGDGAPGVEAAIRLDERLSAEQKETLIAVYRGFLS